MKNNMELDTREVLVYTRYSSDNQQYSSIEAQREKILAYAKINDLEVDEIIEDPEVSGRTPDRKGLKELIKRIKANKVKIVIVHKKDRLHRSIELSIELEKVFRKHNVKLFVVDGNSANETAKDKLFNRFDDMIAEFYTENLSEEVKKGTIKNAQKGKVNGGTAPFGYQLPKGTKKYEILESEACIVREIFSYYSQGNGYNKLIKHLEALGYKTRKGNAFGKSSLSHILKNTSYIGTLTYNKISQSKDWDRVTFDSSTIVTNNDSEDLIIVEDAFDAIIDKDTFEKVQQMLSKRNNNQSNGQKSTAKNLYLLSGLIYCGKCGEKMIGNASPSSGNSETLYYYVCSGKRAKKEYSPMVLKEDVNGIKTFVKDEKSKLFCDNDSIRKEQVERLVLNAIVDRFFNHDSANNSDSSVVNVLIKEVNGLSKVDTKALKSKQKQITRNIKSLKNSLTVHIATDNKHSIELLEEKINVAVKELEEIKTMLKFDSSITVKQIDKIFQSSFVDYMMTDDRREERKAVITSLIKKVLVYDSKIEIHFNAIVNNEEDTKVCNDKIDTNDKGNVIVLDRDKLVA